MKNEKWRDITGWPYQVSNHGRVRRFPRSTRSSKDGILKPYWFKNGYGYITLHEGKRRLGCRIHVLVAKAFIGPRPKGKGVNHKDCNKRNNAVSNLEYCTPKENVIHALKNGSWRSLTKLTPQQVREIRANITDNNRQAGEKYGVSYQTIWSIRLGTRYAWVD